MVGSVADRLVRKSGVPILFVRRQAESPDLSEEPLVRHVLIPLDGSALAESILEPVLALGNAVQTEYTLLRIVMPAELSYGPAGGKITGFQESLKHLRELDEQESKRAYDYLEPLAERLRARSFVVRTRVARHERPAAAILDDATVHAADLIALATHGRGGLKRLVLGSVVDKVLRGADVAVLLYRPDDLSAPAQC
jgi:nucleotide-binding universal stress UspA family protein